MTCYVTMSAGYDKLLVFLRKQLVFSKYKLEVVRLTQCFLLGFVMYKFLSNPIYWFHKLNSSKHSYLVVHEVTIFVYQTIKRAMCGYSQNEGHS